MIKAHHGVKHTPEEKYEYWRKRTIIEIENEAIDRLYDEDYPLYPSNDDLIDETKVDPETILR